MKRECTQSFKLLLGTIDFERFECFKDGRRSNGRWFVSIVDIQKRWYCDEKAWNGHKLTVRELVNKVEISIGLCRKILTKNVQIKTVAAKFIVDFRTERKSFNDFSKLAQFFVPKTQFALKRQRFQYVKAIKENVTTKLKALISEWFQRTKW